MITAYASQWTLLQNYFPTLTPIQANQLAALGKLYVDWNEKINLISRNDIQNLYTHHILHSLSIAKIIDFRPGASILDLGTGGGFPGIPLAILYPKTQFLLVDSIGKKIKVVQDIVEKVNLLNVTTQQARAEKISGTFDFIVSRAVTKLPTIYDWCKDKIKQVNEHAIPNGILYLRGNSPLEGLENIPVHYKVYPIANLFAHPFFETKQITHLYPTATTSK